MHAPAVLLYGTTVVEKRERMLHKKLWMVIQDEEKRNNVNQPHWLTVRRNNCQLIVNKTNLRKQTTKPVPTIGVPLAPSLGQLTSNDLREP